MGSSGSSWPRAGPNSGASSGPDPGGAGAGRAVTGLLARLVRLADLVAALALGALLGVVALSILARLVFDLTGQRVNLMVPGAIELSRHALLVLVLAALPGAAGRGFIRVDLVLGALPRGLAGALERLWLGLTAALAGLLAWLLGAEAVAERARGEVTQDLALALWPFTAFAALAALLLAATALALALGWRPSAPR